MRDLPPDPPPAAAVALHTSSHRSSSTTNRTHSLRILKISPQKSCSSQTIALPLFSKLGSNAFLPTASLALNSTWALATEDSWLAPEQRYITGMFVDTVAGRGTENGDAKNYHEMPSGILLYLDYGRFFSTVNTCWKSSSNILKVSMMGNVFLYKKYLKLDIVSSSVQGRYIPLAHHPFRSPAPRVQRALCWAEWNERVSHQDKVCLHRTVTEKGLWGGCLLETAAGLGCRVSLLGGQEASVVWCFLLFTFCHPVQCWQEDLDILKALVFGQPRCLACF